MNGLTKTLAMLVAGLICTASSSQAQQAAIRVTPSVVRGEVSRYLTGACIEDVNHEIYGGIYSQMIFGESFQEPAPSVPLAGFSTYGGNWVPRDGVVYASAGAGPKLIYDDLVLTNGEAAVELLFPSNNGGNAGLIVKVSQPGTGADVFNGYEISLAPAGYLVLGRHRQNWESIRQVPCTVPLNQWIKLRVVMSATALEVFVNDVSLTQYTDTVHPLAAGKVGLRTWEQAAQYRNLTFALDDALRTIPFELDTNAWGVGISGMWKPLRRDSAQGFFDLETTSSFVGSQSQRMTFTGGNGEIGIENQGLNGWGMFFSGGHPYEGCLVARADQPMCVVVALESGDGNAVYAEQSLAVTSNDWQRIEFSLTPAVTNSNGRFAIKLRQPGSVEIGYAFLQPGEWGRFAGLPVRKDVVDGLIDQGITVLRNGGSMVNASGYRWKNMMGPRDQRPPYKGTWYDYSSDGWGIPDFLNLCEVAGFLGIPAFNMNEKPQDMADFVDYAKGSMDGPWGAHRAADGHPQPYHLKYIELGNEEVVNDNYYQKFAALAEAIWSRDTNITLVVGDLCYSQTIANPFSFSGAASGITTLAAHQKILKLAKSYGTEVWFDVHVGTEGPQPDSSLAGAFSYNDALTQIADGARFKVVVFELNAGNHAQRRALANALAINAAERDGRFPVVTSANCLQPDGQNDNGWDQGLLFLNPSQVWLQPPGHVTRMISRNYQPLLVQSSVQNSSTSLTVTARRSRDGAALVLEVVNTASVAAAAAIQMNGFAPTSSVAKVECLAGALDAVNTAEEPLKIVPAQSEWAHDYTNGVVHYSFAPYSFTILTFQGALLETSAPALKHRWSFNEPAGSTRFVDSVLNVTNGIVNGVARLDGKGNLVLPGLAGNTNYAALPSCLIDSDQTALTFEFWVTFGTNPQWGRLLDFGDTNPTTGSGRYCIDFTPHSGYSPGGINFEASGTDPGASSVSAVSMAPILDNSGKLHLVLIWDSVAQYMAVYTNGTLQGINANVTLPMPAIHNAHSWLGKSSYLADSCGVATIDEFRMYDGALDNRQITADFKTGPEELPTPGLELVCSGSKLVFCWPDFFGPEYYLEMTRDLGSSAYWLPLNAAPIRTEGSYQVTISMDGNRAFYRLAK